MPDIPAEAVQAAAEALRTKRWGSRGTSAHRAHRFHADCEVCQGNVEAIAEVAVQAAAPFLAGVESPVSCPPAAPESTQSPAGASVAPVYPPDPLEPAETLSALRDRYAEAIKAAAVDCDGNCGRTEEECRDHVGLIWSGTARAGRPDEVTWVEGTTTAIADAVLAVRDDELSRALRIADYHATQHRQAEAAVARSRAALAEFDARPWHDVPTPGSVLEAWRTSLAVSDEQTGPLRHLGGNAEDCPACDITTLPYPFLCPGEEQAAPATTEETNR